MVRPDLMIVYGSQPERYLQKAPSLVIEILSDSTADKDRHAKRELYENNSVKHYLIADTAENTIQWFELHEDGKYEDVSIRISPNGEFSLSLEGGCDIQFECKSAFASPEAE